MMKLTVLGPCGGFPAAGEATSGYLLELDGRHILIDCGSGVLSNLFRFISLDQLDAVILTHLHTDHICDIPMLKQAIELYRQKRHGTCRQYRSSRRQHRRRSAENLQSDGVLIVGQIIPGSTLNLYGAQLRFPAHGTPGGNLRAGCGA